MEKGPWRRSLRRHGVLTEPWTLLAQRYIHPVLLRCNLSFHAVTYPFKALTQLYTSSSSPIYRVISHQRKPTKTRIVYPRRVSPSRCYPWSTCYWPFVSSSLYFPALPRTVSSDPHRVHRRVFLVRKPYQKALEKNRYNVGFVPLSLWFTSLRFFHTFCMTDIVSKVNQTIHCFHLSFSPTRQWFLFFFWVRKHYEKVRVAITVLYCKMCGWKLNIFAMVMGKVWCSHASGISDCHTTCLCNPS